MAKSIEHGVRSPKQEPGADKKEKQLAYGVRAVGDSFDRRGNETNPGPAPSIYHAPGPKFDSQSPTFKKF